jgi:hypothetical protein
MNLFMMGNENHYETQRLKNHQSMDRIIGI